MVKKIESTNMMSKSKGAKESGREESLQNMDLDKRKEGAGCVQLLYVTHIITWKKKGRRNPRTP